MAEIESESKSEKSEQLTDEINRDAETSASSLSSDIWKGTEISKLNGMVNDRSTVELKSAGFGDLSIIGFDKNSVLTPADHSEQNTRNQEKNLEKKEIPEGPKSDLEKRYGVEIREKDGHYEYVLKANGKETVVCESYKSVDGMREAEAKLREAAEEKIKEIEEKYGIKITKEGETVSGVGHDEDRDRKFHARTPTLKELAALEEALKRTGDSCVTRDPSKPLAVTFAQEEFGPFGFYNPESNHLFMFTNHNGRDKMPATHADREGERTDKDPPDLKHIILHELAHHSQLSFPPDEKTREKEYREQGWVQSKDKEKDGSPKYEFLGKDGYQYELEAGKDGFTWRRKDADGNYIDKDGNPVDSSDKAHSMSIKEMRENALVPPATDYFFFPIEQQGENLALLRAGGDVTGKFIRENHELYQATRSTDQRHIDSVFGRNDDGSSKMIRMPDGTIAENNRQNQERLKEFEKQWRR